MTGRTEIELLLDRYLADGAEQVPDRVIDVALDQIDHIHQRRVLRVPWRFHEMPSFVKLAMAGAAVVAAIVVGGMFLNRDPGPNVGASPIAHPPPTSAPPAAASIPTPTFTTRTRDWTPYTSEVYAFTTAYPPGWRVEQAATRRWDPAVDVPLDNGLSPAVDVFVNDAGSVAVSAWRVPADIAAIENSTAALIAWVEVFCDSTEYYEPCDGIAERAIPMCRERADCHPDAVMVPFDDDVVAFFVGADDALTVVHVWRPDADPTAAQYGGSIRLLQGFLETMNVVPKPGQGE
jgi:hypothetical protein